jgi:hypothetical protein
VAEYSGMLLLCRHGAEDRVTRRPVSVARERSALGVDGN